MFLSRSFRTSDLPKAAKFKKTMPVYHKARIEQQDIEPQEDFPRASGPSDDARFRNDQAHLRGPRRKAVTPQN